MTETVYLPEGEKDVRTLEAWDLVASCNSGGSGESHLHTGWVDHFRNRHIIILPDNDGPGRKHAVVVATALLTAAASIRVVELPGLPPKGDATDWRDAGGNSANLSRQRSRWMLHWGQHNPQYAPSWTSSGCAGISRFALWMTPSASSTWSSSCAVRWKIFNSARCEVAASLG